MKIEKGTDYDVGLDRFLGNITLPPLNDLAKNALVFMIGGISSLFKQIICYHFTGLGTTGSHVKDVAFEIIMKCENIGFRVHSVTTDMGPMNIQMWNAFNVSHTKSHIAGNILHPCDPKRRLYFFADVPHLLKNLAQSLLNNKTIKIADNIVKKYDLPSNIIKSEHIQKLVDFQKDRVLKFSPKLQQYNLQPTSLQKMKVFRNYLLSNK